MKEKSYKIIEKLPRFFSKLGEAMKLTEQHEQHLMMNLKGAEIEKRCPH